MGICSRTLINGRRKLSMHLVFADNDRVEGILNLWSGLLCSSLFVFDQE